MEIYPAHGMTEHKAIESASRLVIGAHPDDIELLVPGIVGDSALHPERHLVAIVMTEGSGSQKVGAYAGFSLDELARARKKEQVEAAKKGKYTLVQLPYSSAQIKNLSSFGPNVVLSQLMADCGAQDYFTHHALDSHETHLATLLRVAHSIPKSTETPEAFFGAEVCWGDMYLAHPRVVEITTYGKDEARIAFHALDAHVSQNAYLRYDQFMLLRDEKNTDHYRRSEGNINDGNKYTTPLMNMTPLTTGKPVEDFLKEDVGVESEAHFQKIAHLRANTI